MSQRVGGTNPGTYLGVNALTPPNFRQVNRAPTTNDTKTFRLGDIWQQTNTENFWILAKLSATMASPNVQVADWMKIANGSLAVYTLTGNTGGAVGVDGANNINVVGDNITVTVVGNPATHTLELSTIPTAVVSTLIGDDGIPVTPLAGAIDVLGTPLGGSSVAFTGATPHELQLNVTDSRFNTLIGRLAGNSTLTASNNVSLGYNTGHALTNGTQNVFIGMGSGADATSADNNTAVGWAALDDLVTGSNNIAIGLIAGTSYTTSESSNIVIGNVGVISENNTLRLGTTGVGAGEVSRCFVAGVDGVNVGNTANVVTEVGGQLGTAVITAGVGITVTPGANTITIASGGVDAQSFVTNAGTAIPVAGVLNILGGTAITTSGAGNTVTITNTGSGVGGSLSFKGSLPAAAAIAGGGAPSYLGATVAMQTIYDNSGGAWNPGNGAGTRASFTAPATGIYVFTLYYDMISLNANNTQCNQFILGNAGNPYSINAVNIYAMSFNTGATQEAAISGTIQINLTMGTVVNFGCTLVGTAAQWLGNNVSTDLYTSVSGYRLA